MILATVSKRSMVWLGCVLLTGCVLGRAGAPVSIVAPVLEVATDPAWPQAEWSLQVPRPVTDQMRDSNRILVRRSRSKLQVYPASVWFDAAPDMLQGMLIRGFEDSGRLTGVSRPGGTRGRFRLGTEIRRFEAVDDGGRHLRADIEVHATLVHTRSSRVVAGRTFSRQVDARGSDLDPLVVAFESALEGMLTEIVGWVLTEGVAQSEVLEPRGGQRRRPERS